jgi:ribose transport system ATP-binding protein
MPTAPRLEMRGIRKAFGPTQALARVDLAVGAGECLAIIGENGAGKSTLMKVLSGAHHPDGGEMRLDGEPFAPRDPHAARLRGVGIVYQELTIVRHLSVAENVVLGAEPSQLGAVRQGERDRIARQALEMLGIGDLPLATLAGSLSVAQQQLVEIARALALGIPRVLVLDEPTASLTASDASRLFTAIDRLVAAGTAVLFISHHLEECRRVATRFLVLRDGTSVGGGAMVDADEGALIRLMVGREVTELFPRIPHTLGEPLLEVQALAGRTLPQEASFTLRAGEILGIFGLVGSGRTEMLRVLFGLDPVASGTVRLRGQPLTGRSPRASLAAGIGLVSEDRKEEGLALGMSIADNLTLTRLAPVATAGCVDAARQQAAAATWMQRLWVKAASPAQPIGQLSGGNQQKVAIGRLLYHDAQILLLDEPTRGIDVGAKAQVYRLLGELAAEGRALIVVSSYIPELMGVCDTIAVMRRGRLSSSRPVASWDAHTILTTALGGEAA